jgi:hypothetical protein
MAEVDGDGPVEGGLEDQLNFWFAIVTVLLKKHPKGQVVVTIDEINEVDNYAVSWSSAPDLKSVLLTLKAKPSD